MSIVQSFQNQNTHAELDFILFHEKFCKIPESVRTCKYNPKVGVVFCSGKPSSVKVLMTEGQIEIDEICCYIWGLLHI